MPDADVQLAQALADIASIAILQAKPSKTHSSATISSNTPSTAESSSNKPRALAERAHRRHGHRAQLDTHAGVSSNTQLTTIATRIITGELAPTDIAAKPPTPQAVSKTLILFTCRADGRDY